MEKIVQSLQAHDMSARFSRSDWKEAAFAVFRPYFLRPTKLRENIDSFMVELRNIARFIEHPEHLALFEWCLALHRRVLRADREGSYHAMHQLFSNMQISDQRWINIFQATNPLPSDAAPQDIVFQLFSTIDDVAEACFKPQLEIIYWFALRDAAGAWPHDVRPIDFGTLVARFPSDLSLQVPLLLTDPCLGITVNQWRNIAAHKSFNFSGPQTIQVTYGKGNTRTTKFGLKKLREASRWLIKTHNAVRLANTITFVEHMREIVALGKPNTDMPIATTVLQVGHGLSTVGFELISWDVKKRAGRMVIRDKLNRTPRDALIHASQQLVDLSIGVLSDVSSRARIDTVSMQLQLPDGSTFGTAQVSVDHAYAFSRRRIGMRRYLDQVQWILSPKNIT